MDNNFEKLPNSPETKGEYYVPPDQDFEKKFAEGGVPEFNGFGVKKDNTNELYGDFTREELEQVIPEQAELNQTTQVNVRSERAESENKEPDGSMYNETLMGASAIVDYGLDAVARQRGVEAVAEEVKNFDESSSENPIGDLYKQMGIDTAEEVKEVNEESLATKDRREELAVENNMPELKEKNEDNARQAIRDMKDLITEVEKVGPQYEELRQGALEAGKGEFDYAVEDKETQGLTEAFSVLSEQKEKEEKPTSAEAPMAETPPDQIPPNTIEFRRETVGDQEKEELVV